VNVAWHADAFDACLWYVLLICIVKFDCVCYTNAGRSTGMLDLSSCKWAGSGLGATALMIMATLTTTLLPVTPFTSMYDVARHS